MSIPVDWTEPECGQLSPTSVLSLRHHSTEDILTEALEKVRILEQLQNQRQGSSSLDLVPGKSQGSGEEFSCSQSISSSCSSGGDTRLKSSQSNQWRRNKGSGGGSGGDEDEYEEDEDKTPTPPPPPPHSRLNSRLTPPHLTTSLLPHSPSHAHHPNCDQPSYLQSPYVTPLSAKNNRYLLHPDVMNQHFSSEISVLPVPHILCPTHTSGGGGGGGIPSLAGMLGDDYTVDEKAYLADMIALKYLGSGGSRNHQGGEPTESRQLGYGRYIGVFEGLYSSA
jgi:hypothetical protein